MFYITFILTAFVLPNAYSEFDSTMQDLFCEKIDQEKETIEKNKVILGRIKSDLDKKVKNGMLEQELCIRKGISALKTIDYAYNSMLLNLSSTDCSKLRLQSFNELQRTRNVNGLFANVNMKIEECLLRNSVSGKNNMANEIIKDEVVGKKEIIKNNINIPQDYPAARSPFR